MSEARDRLLGAIIAAVEDGRDTVEVGIRDLEIVLEAAS